MAHQPKRFSPRPLRTAREVDRDRGSARARGYSRRWDLASRQFLRDHPLCEYCQLREGRVTASACTDHLYPHRGDERLFWFEPWWVASCTDCHSGWKQALEHQGVEALAALASRLGRPPWPGPVNH